MTDAMTTIIEEAKAKARAVGHDGDVSPDPFTSFVVGYLATLASATAQTTSPGYVRAGLPPVESRDETVPSPTTVEGER